MNQIEHPAIAPNLPELFVGCAGWALPRLHAEDFPGEGSHLVRYAQVFNAVEVNSSFYRNHQPKTYRRWGDAVPQAFRFSVKFPRSITHDAGLQHADELMRTFLADVDELGPRLGCLLLQLPPKLAWDARVVEGFFQQLRHLHSGPVVCEPRHASWFNATVGRVLAEHRVGRVGADPALSARARIPAGDPQLQYLRLHGSPRMYRDSYDDTMLLRLAEYLQQPAGRSMQRWCMFDNTTEGHAIPNALKLTATLASV